MFYHSQSRDLRTPARPTTDTSEEQRLSLQIQMPNNLCTRRRWDSEGGCQESEEETATPLQPLDSMKKEREPGGWRGV